jgi:hypothetical protein
VETGTSGRDYLDHLTDADLELVASASGSRGRGRLLRGVPQHVPRLLDRPEVFDAVYGPQALATGRLVGVSPFLAFAVAVHRAAADLASARYVPERSGLRQRVPVFDAPQLSNFLDDPARRLFLAELLASFTQVASGRYWVRTAGGWRSRRYSELDPVRLAGLVEALPEAERPGGYRRLGDAVLFLAGVFPDHTRGYALGPLDAARLLRAVGQPPAARESLAAASGLELFEHLGSRCYRQACALVQVPSGRLAVVAEVAERFRQARRILNHVADRYLFPAGNPWFPSPG